ncbi:MAG: helix-turn-helix domain-containing protein [Nitrospirae bacterium]|nr:helix-turn-helix domain-containing protein [Nitrospirota bacterium]
MRKTDDSVILQMHEEGKSLREIAEKFGCSKTAISKRLKRVKGKPPVDPEKKVSTVAEDNQQKPIIQQAVSTGNYLRKIGTREIFAYSDRLMQRGDMVPYVGDIPVPSDFEVSQFEITFLKFISGKGMVNAEDFKKFTASSTSGRKNAN